jgi:hypothetical protein
MPGAEIVHTDDIAWAHSRFGWDDLMVQGVLDPLHRGQAVHYQPPTWPSHGRAGQIDVSANASLVIVEGVGAARRELIDLQDAAVWVQSDFREAERRATLRNCGDTAAMEQTREWMTEEIPFLAADRPWERATIIVAGTPDITHDPIGEVVVAPPLLQRKYFAAELVQVNDSSPSRTRAAIRNTGRDVLGRRRRRNP